MKSTRKILAVLLAVVMLFGTFTVSASVFAATKKSVTKVALNKTKATVTVSKTITLKVTVSPSNATNKTVKWTTSDSKVATVTSKGVVKGVKVGSATITATATDGSKKKATCKITVAPQKVTSISMSKKSATVAKGDKLTLKATVSPSNATNKTLKWSTSNSKVATVTSKGVVSGIKDGTATITATATDGSKKSATCKVTVKTQKVTSVKLSKTSASVMQDSTITLSATVSPSNATDKSLTWSTSDSKIAKVSSKGVVTGVAVGKATIKATAKDGSKKYASCTVTVTKKIIKCTALTINSNINNWVSGIKCQLTVTPTPSNVTNSAVTWSSSDEKIATVDSKGNVTAGSSYTTGVSIFKKTINTATITATAKDGSGVKATYTIKLGDTKPALKFNIEQASFYETKKMVGEVEKTYQPERYWVVGQSGHITAYLLPVNSATKDVVYSVSNSKIGKIDSDGYFTALKEGTVTITATIKNTNISTSITLPITTLTIESAVTHKINRDYFYVGEEANLNSYCKFGSLAKDVPGGITYVSSNPLVATVQMTGAKKTAKLVFKAPGTAKIYAVSNITGVKSNEIDITVRGLGGKTVYENVKAGDTITLSDLIITDDGATNIDEEEILLDTSLSKGGLEDVIVDGSIVFEDGSWKLTFKSDASSFSGYIVAQNGDYSLTQRIYFSSGKFTSAPTSTSKSTLLSHIKTLSQSLTTAQTLKGYKRVVSSDTDIDLEQSGTSMTFKLGKLDFTDTINRLLSDGDADLSLSDISATDLVKGLFDGDASNGMPNAIEIEKPSSMTVLTVSESDVSSIKVTDSNSRYYTITMNLKSTSKLPIADVSKSGYAKSMNVVDKDVVDKFTATGINLSDFSDESMSIDELEIKSGTVYETLSNGYVSYTVDKMTGKVVATKSGYHSKIFDSNASMHLKMTLVLSDEMKQSLGSFISTAFSAANMNITIDIKTGFRTDIDSVVEYTDIQY